MHTCALASGQEASDNGYFWGRPIVAHKGLPDLGKGGIVAHLSLAKVVRGDKAQVPGVILAGMDALHGRQGQLQRGVRCCLAHCCSLFKRALVKGIVLAGMDVLALPWQV